MSHISDTFAVATPNMPKHNNSMPSTFKNNYVRQLAWTISSPQLIEGVDQNIWSSRQWCREQAAIAHPWLASLDKDPTDLHQFIDAEKDHRLGARFERFIEFWLNHSSSFGCTSRRLQWIHHDRTHGEFDFIVENRLSGQTEHWEVATKFYLGLPIQSDGGLAWIGPGKRDRLTRKLDHLLNKQLRLGKSVEARSFLNDLDIHIDRVRAWVKGRLFYPIDAALEQHSVAPIGTDHERGIWCERRQLESLQPLSLTLLAKSDWLDPTPDKKPASSSEITEVLNKLHRGPVCCDMELKTTQRLRVFILEDGWFDGFS